MDPIDPLYVVARTVLLDALEALDADRAALILVGAQAVYLRTGQSGLPIAPYTSDADLAIQPLALRSGQEPLDVRLRAMGFTAPARNPGAWQKLVMLGESHTEWIQLDLMVPEALVTNNSRRSARIAGQNLMLARRTLGLEAALIDQDLLLVTALDNHDVRAFQTIVAGPVALLLAKGVKLLERADTPREQGKDALDVLRLLQATTDEDLMRRLRRVLGDPTLGKVTSDHAGMFLEAFSSAGVGMRLLRAEAGKLRLDPRLVGEIVQRGTGAITEALA